MKVILLKDITGIGRRGQVIEASPGYANNFLLKKGLAQTATPDILKRVGKETQEAEAKNEREAAEARRLKNLLEKQGLTIKVKTGERGQIFGGVSASDIAAEIKARFGADVGKQQILPPHAKSVGQYPAEVKLGHGLKAIMSITLEPLT